MRRLLTMLALVAAACRPADVPMAPAPAEQDRPVSSADPAPAPARAADLDMFGEWQVSALETSLLDATDRRLGDPNRVVFLTGLGRIEVASQCVPFHFEYRREGDRLRLTPLRWSGPICARGLMPYERILDRLLGSVTRLEPVTGGVRLAGSAGSVTLRRPLGGYLDNPFQNQPSPGPQLLWGHFRLVEAGGASPPAGQPVEVALGRSWIEARSGCIPFRWEIEWNPRFALTGASMGGPVCERAMTPAEQALERVMPSVRGFEWTAPYQLRLTGPAGSVTLRRVTGSAT